MTNGDKFCLDFPGITTRTFKTEGFTYIEVEKDDKWIADIDIEWWNSEYKEPTTKNDKVDCEHTDCNNCVNHKYCDYELNKSEIPTGSTTKNDLALIHTEGLDEEIRCIMCTNSMKSNRGCDGSCVVNKDMYKAVMDAIEKRIQPTTKNNLEVDCISREQALNEFCIYNPYDSIGVDKVRSYLNALPPITPQEPSWIPVSEGLPKEGGDYLTTISFDIGAKEPVREVYKDFFCVLSQKWLNHDEDVIAWMQVPQAYKADMNGNTRRKGKPIEDNNESYNCENWIP